MKTVFAISTGIFVGMVIGTWGSIICSIDDPETWHGVLNSYQYARNKKNDVK